MEYHPVTPTNTGSRTAIRSGKAPTQLALAIISGITVLLTLATTFLIIALTVALGAWHSRSYVLSIMAAISQFVSLCTLCFLVVCRFRRGDISLSDEKFKSKQRRYWFLLGYGIMPSTLAAVLVAVTLGWIKGSLIDMSKQILGRAIATYLIIAFVVWGLSVLAQAFFYLLSTLIRKPHSGDAPMVLASTPEVPSETVIQSLEQSRPVTSTTVQSVQSNPFRGSEYSTPPSLIPSEGTSSLRSSLSTVRGPSLSKARLVGRNHSFHRHSKNPSSSTPSSSRPSQDSAFDSWDTSSVGSHIRETVLQSSPSMKVPILEPIPGSRSPSPAKALEGPFFQPSPPESSPPSPLPQPSYSRPTSPRSASSEDHIHPLFRTCSPTPPPTASSNTVVTAAPSAGQIINERMLLRMRSGSLPSTSPKGPLVRSESFDHFFTTRNPTSPNLGLGVNNSRPSTSPRETWNLKHRGNCYDLLRAQRHDFTMGIW